MCAMNSSSNGEEASASGVPLPPDNAPGVPPGIPIPEPDPAPIQPPPDGDMPLPGDPPTEQPMRMKEVGGPKGPEPTRYGDWEKKGRVSDF